jgi:UDP-N-acetylglucosamine diphosphorylase / glucose-1-phosphate thymidylyltransferase / UDP-N-acetylgalactosamine diphosphorylase / glucosamine-1-phosphate N-acetyltransferase / galactosamine-1-phosphate N-acetyltransferase
MSLLDEHIATFRASALGEFVDSAPWELTLGAVEIVQQLASRLSDDYAARCGVAIHGTATIEGGAIIKGPAIIGPNCFVATGAYVRDGCWLEAGCILGPGTELKSSFMFADSKLAHFNFVGDSILGTGVNLEAGSIIANYRNELATPTISLIHENRRIDTGAKKFGALVGDHVRIGANAVIAPGAVLVPGTIVPRLSLIDQISR